MAENTSNKLQSFTEFLPSLLGTVESLRRTDNALNLSVQGANLAANQFRLSGAANLAQGQYNAALQKLNTNRQLDALSREIRSTLSSQQVLTATSGLSTTSKSFLAVMNDTLTKFERQIVDLRSVSEQRQRQILFDAESRRVQAENQARAQVFSGQIQANAAKNQKAKIGQSLFNQGLNLATTLLGE